MGQGTQGRIHSPMGNGAALLVSEAEPMRIGAAEDSTG